MSIPFFSKEQVILKPKEQKFIIVGVTIYRGNFGHSHSEDATYLRANYSHVEIEIH